MRHPHLKRSGVAIISKRILEALFRTYEPPICSVIKKLLLVHNLSTLYRVRKSILHYTYCTHTSGPHTEDVRIFAADLVSAFPVILRINNRSSKRAGFTQEAARPAVCVGETAVVNIIKDALKLLPAN